MIHYPDVDNAMHSHLGVGDDRGNRTAIHLPLWSDVGGFGGGTGAGLAAAVTGILNKLINRKFIIALQNTEKPRFLSNVLLKNAKL